MIKKEKYFNKEGERAINFCLLNQNFKKICLKDFFLKKQKVLLFFYPKDMTPGCTIEAILFSNFKTKIENKGIMIFGISKLDSNSKKKFIEKNNLKINLLSDEDLKICNKYGVWREKNMFGKKVMGIARETFLIQEDGIILKHWQKVKPENHLEEVMNYLNKLK